ncbi:peptidase S8/S53 domain-containing protein [Cyathus striatus]|nr:peptidase S8/S53 domain-containing protein [Cyathus striatus]
MHLPTSLLALLLVQFTITTTAKPAARTYGTHDYYVLEHRANEASASLDEVARALGVEIVERAGELADHWLVRTVKPQESNLAVRGSDHDHVLDKFENMKAKAAARFVRRGDEEHYDLAKRVASSVNYLDKQVLRQLEKRAPPPIRPPLPQRPAATSAEVASRMGFRDPLFGDQWHLVNDEFPEHTMNVTGLWEMGLTGKGVISSLLDDGLDYTSEDLAANFDADDSHDFNDHVALPTPKDYRDHHGTRCAGQIAAGKNTACGVGIAYESKVAGVRILSGPISSVDEAAALNYGYQNVSIYSCSWGPRDNGETMAAPNYLIKKAVVNGINNGRQGKGSIFVFASGNGGGYGDQCNFDGYTNSIYSVTVGAVDYTGQHPFYSEACAANMVVAYSSGSGEHIVTTDKGTNECAYTHGGTSAAAPNAVGVFALALQVRPDLTWRDIQHLCVETARKINPDDPDWEKMASGQLYSYKYGFGVLDGYRYVTAAQTWNLVKPQAWFSTETVQIQGGTYMKNKFSGGQFIGDGGVESKVVVTQSMLTENNFEKLEHINVKVWIDHSRRGDVQVELVSPKGIRSVLAKPRHKDEATTGFPGWTFMTVKHWGEDPSGEWTLKVSDQNSTAENNGTFLGWNMMFWGSTIDASKAKKYDVPLVEDVLPPVQDTVRPVIAEHPSPSSSSVSSTTTPATTSSATTTSYASLLPGIDTHWVDEIIDTLYSHKLYSAALSGIFVCSIAGVIFLLCRRRRSPRQVVPGEYSAVSGVDEAGMGMGPVMVTAGPRTMNMNMADNGPPGRSGAGLGFHSAFLDDDDMSTAGPTPRYRDVPDIQVTPAVERQPKS